MMWLALAAPISHTSAIPVCALQVLRQMHASLLRLGGGSSSGGGDFLGGILSMWVGRASCIILLEHAKRISCTALPGHFAA